MQTKIERIYEKHQEFYRHFNIPKESYSYVLFCQAFHHARVGVEKADYFHPSIGIKAATIGIHQKLAARSTNIILLSLSKPCNDSELKQLRFIHRKHEGVVNACFVHIKNICQRN